ncbi:MAG: hypothetical protein H6598_03765 [Flavobacteriales bacterium]|nr:hypothetical protein [Flavobacteriales bacterium]
METNDKNIDQILLNRKYNDLTPEELLLVKKEITSESEYNDLRTMLLAAQKEILSSEELEPKASTKDFLMKEFTKIHPAMQTNTRAGGLGFLFPKGKAFYQKPGYQLIAVAALLVLIFTIYPKLSSNMTSNEDVAINSTGEQKNKNTDLKEEIEPVSKEKSEITEEIQGKKPLEQESADQITTGSSESLKSDLNLSAASYNWDNNDDSSIDIIVIADGTFAVEDALASDEILAEQPASNTSEFESSKSPVTETVATGGVDSDYYRNQTNNSVNNTVADNMMDMAANEVVSADKEAEESLNATPALAKVEEKDRSNKKSDFSSPPVKTIKSLAENAELIDLFYTAM